MKAYRDSGSIAPPLLTLVQNRGKWFASCVSHFTPGQGRETLVSLNGGWVDPRPGLDILEKIKSVVSLGI